MSESYDYSSNLNRLNEILISKLAQKLSETFLDLRELNLYSKQNIKDEPKEIDVLVFEFIRIFDILILFEHSLLNVGN